MPLEKELKTIFLRNPVSRTLPINALLGLPSSLKKSNHCTDQKGLFSEQPLKFINRVSGLCNIHQSNLVMANVEYLTQEGYNRLKKELDEMKSTERRKVAQAIAEAREKGDLSENAEYDAAKDAQGMLELKINDLEKRLASAKILDVDQLDTSKVTVLSKVTIRNKKNKKEITYQLVSESEADLKQKKISINSPMGKGLLGKEIGETAYVETPRGSLEFEIVHITL